MLFARKSKNISNKGVGPVSFVVSALLVVGILFVVLGLFGDVLGFKSPLCTFGIIKCDDTKPPIITGEQENARIELQNQITCAYYRCVGDPNDKTIKPCDFVKKKFSSSKTACPCEEIDKIGNNDGKVCDEESKKHPLAFDLRDITSENIPYVSVKPLAQGLDRMYVTDKCDVDWSFDNLRVDLKLLADQSDPSNPCKSCDSKKIPTPIDQCPKSWEMNECKLQNTAKLNNEDKSIYIYHKERIFGALPMIGGGIHSQQVILCSEKPPGSVIIKPPPGPSKAIGCKDDVAKWASNYNKYSEYVDKAISDSKAPSLKELSNKNENPHALVAAIISQESSWNPDALSTCGALGLMQLMPDSARFIGGLIVPSYDIVSIAGSCSGTNDNVPVCSNNPPKATFDQCNRAADQRLVPEKNILAGAIHISGNLQECQGNMEHALSRYWGRGCQSTEYSQKVMKYYSQWKACISTKSGLTSPPDVSDSELKNEIKSKFGVDMIGGWDSYPQHMRWIFEKFWELKQTSPNFIKMLNSRPIELCNTCDVPKQLKGYVQMKTTGSYTNQKAFITTLMHELGHDIYHNQRKTGALSDKYDSIYRTNGGKAFTSYANIYTDEDSAGNVINERLTENYAEMITFCLTGDAVAHHSKISPQWIDLEIWSMIYKILTEEITGGPCKI